MYLGIDIGGTKTDAVIIDAAGEILGRHRVASGTGEAAVVAAAVEAAQAACAQAGASREEVTVGIGIPGTVVDGVVSHALNLAIDRADVAGAFAAAWGRAAVVDNDVNAAAVGAWSLIDQADQPVDSMAYLNLGTGLAAGIILGGRLWRGARGSAGEIGHVSVDPAGPVGADGLPGGLETYASGSGLTLQWGGGRGADIVAAAEAGDTQAQAICQGAYFGLASAVRVLVLTLDVDRVIVGGGMTAWGAPLIDGARAVLDDWAGTSPFLASLGLSDRVGVMSPRLPVAAIGAAMMGGGRG